MFGEKMHWLRNRALYIVPMCWLSTPYSRTRHYLPYFQICAERQPNITRHHIISCKKERKKKCFSCKNNLQTRCSWSRPTNSSGPGKFEKRFNLSVKLLRKNIFLKSGLQGGKFWALHNLWRNLHLFLQGIPKKMSLLQSNWLTKGHFFWYAL